VYAALSLTVVRMAPVAVAMLGAHARRPTVAFLGWSGPRGLASLVFGVLLLDETHLPHEQDLLVAIALTVGISVLVHGLSARPLTDRYVRWYSGRVAGGPLPMESTPAAAHPVRIRARTGGSAGG
jgi:sodium/hydrogen antiporter